MLGDVAIASGDNLLSILAGPVGEERLMLSPTHCVYGNTSQLLASTSTLPRR